jgi:hypothetical protein
MKAKSNLPDGVPDTSIIIKGKWTTMTALNWCMPGDNLELFCFSENCMMKIEHDFKKSILCASVDKLERKLTKSYFHDDNKMEKQINNKMIQTKLEKKLGKFYKIISFF